MSRELLRSLFKPIGAQLWLPFLERHYRIDENPKSKAIVAHLFALSMAGSDALLSPIDSIRTRKQKGERAIPTLSEAKGRNRLFMLSQGAGANTLRQYIIWWTWYKTKEPSQKLTRQVFKLSPEGIPGLAIQSCMQAVPITLFSILLERIKNFVQIEPNAHVGQGRLYAVAFRQVFNSRPFRGLIAKIGAMGFLVFGFNGLGLLANRRTPPT